MCPENERKSERELDEDLDVTLAHDGLHHLHLGARHDGQWAGRTRDLLLVAFRERDAYGIGVYPHGAWGRREVLERMVRHWPEAGLLMEAQYVTGLTQHFNDEQRWELMKAGVSVSIEIDGKVYAVYGLTAAGTPLHVTRRVNAFMWELTYMREQGLEQRLQAVGADPTLPWEPAVLDEHVGLLTSQHFLAFGRLA